MARPLYGGWDTLRFPHVSARALVALLFSPRCRVVSRKSKPLLPKSQNGHILVQSTIGNQTRFRFTVFRSVVVE
jgi:hypothetical protein